MVRPTPYLCTLFLDSAKKVAASTCSKKRTWRSLFTIVRAATRITTTNLVTICCKIGMPQRDTFLPAAVRSASYRQIFAISYKMKSNGQNQVLPTSKIIRTKRVFFYNVEQSSWSTPTWCAGAAYLTEAGRQGQRHDCSGHHEQDHCIPGFEIEKRHQTRDLVSNRTVQYSSSMAWFGFDASLAILI